MKNYLPNVVRAVGTVVVSLMLSSCIESAPKLSGKYENVNGYDDQKFVLEFLPGDKVSIHYNSFYEGRTIDTETATVGYEVWTQEDGYTRLEIEDNDVYVGWFDNLILTEENDHLIAVSENSNRGFGLLLRPIDTN